MYVTMLGGVFPGGCGLSRSLSMRCMIKRLKATNLKLVPVSTDSAPEGHFFIHPRARSAHHIFVDDKQVH
ncbi:Extreme acid sensitivity protein [Serratia fonticola]|uniref:Extreme acid sensitivity protein n=1 Tax=Serratia fonticola TaxID=47917 RepID=A0A4U9UZ24_SERFO|nr:Extreme acid sensitivity protein [Serratia fonticola]